MLVDIWSNWFLWAMLTPAIWGLVAILDVCLIGSGVYDRAIDGAVISASFSALPLLATLPMIEPTQIEFSAFVSASIAGGCFFFHTLFFLKALFALNDASSADSIDTLGVVLVPALAFLLLDEILVQQHYLAIACATVGTGVLAYGHLRKTGRRALVYSLLSVLFASLATVAQAQALSQTTYDSALAVFSATVLLYACVPMLIDGRYRQRIITLCRRFGVLFIATECLQLAAVLSSHRAVQVAPSVSLVRVAEAASPFFVLIFSVLALRLLGRFSQKPVVGVLQLALVQQLNNLTVKLTALAFISLGVWLIYLAPG